MKNDFVSENAITGESGQKNQYRFSKYQKIPK
jgi:hypothetical protein